MSDTVVIIEDRGARGFGCSIICTAVSIKVLDYDYHISWTKGPYVDLEEENDNQWEFCFEQPCIQSSDLQDQSVTMSLVPFPASQLQKDHVLDVFKNSIGSVFSKFKIKEEIIEAVEEFKIQNGLTVPYASCHVRGTDKDTEIARVPIEYFFVQCDKLLETYPKLFLATDEEPVVNQFVERYGDRVCYQNIIRSTNGAPLHFSNNSGKKMMQGILKDILLLSQSSFMVRTTSSVSAAAICFNPDLNYRTIKTTRSQKYALICPSHGRTGSTVLDNALRGFLGRPDEGMVLLETLRGLKNPDLFSSVNTPVFKTNKVYNTNRQAKITIKHGETNPIFLSMSRDDKVVDFGNEHGLHIDYDWLDPNNKTEEEIVEALYSKIRSAIPSSIPLYKELAVERLKIMNKTVEILKNYPFSVCDVLTGIHGSNKNRYSDLGKKLPEVGVIYVRVDLETGEVTRDGKVVRQDGTVGN